jgi:hypothetical protein
VAKLNELQTATSEGHGAERGSQDRGVVKHGLVQAEGSAMLSKTCQDECLLKL